MAWEFARALAEAETVDELSDLRDQAAAMQRYLARREGAEEAARHALDIRLRAERRIGEMLAESIQHEGGTVVQRDSRLPAGVTRDQSSKYQRIAELSDHEFERVLAGPEP